MLPGIWDWTINPFILSCQSQHGFNAMPLSIVSPGDTQSCKPSWPQSSTTICLKGVTFLTHFHHFPASSPASCLLACLPFYLSHQSEAWRMQVQTRITKRTNENSESIKVSGATISLYNQETQSTRHMIQGEHCKSRSKAGFQGIKNAMI